MTTVDHTLSAGWNRMTVDASWSCLGLATCVGSASRQIADAGVHPGVDIKKLEIKKLEYVIAVYERLTAKEAELAFNAAKGRILKKLERWL